MLRYYNLHFDGGHAWPDLTWRY